VSIRPIETLRLSSEEPSLTPPKRSRLRTLWRWLVTLLALLGLALLIVVFTPLTHWLGFKITGSFDKPQGDVLIVLGGPGVNDGVLGYESYLRAQYAVRAWREGHFRAVHIAGGSTPRPAAPGMRDVMLSQGVPESVITIESASSSTRENALFSRNQLAHIPGTIVLLTSDFHSYRATRVFRKVGIEVMPYPIPDAVKRSESRINRPTLALVEMSEFVKMAYYKLRGWM
jgi:uncharacterized SAM-binding protein YcdF (DUF218 family)